MNEMIPITNADIKWHLVKEKDDVWVAARNLSTNGDIFILGDVRIAKKVSEYTKKNLLTYGDYEGDATTVSSYGYIEISMITMRNKDIHAIYSVTELSKFPSVMAWVNTSLEEAKKIVRDKVAEKNMDILIQNRSVFDRAFRSYQEWMAGKSAYEAWSNCNGWFKKRSKFIDKYVKIHYNEVRREEFEKYLDSIGIEY